MIYTELNFFSQFLGHMGIPIHSRSFAEELDKHIKLNLFQILPFPNSDRKTLNPKLEDKFQVACPITKAANGCNKSFPSLIFWYPTDMIRISDIVDIGYYIFEYTIIPKQFVENLNKMDIICTASEWGVNVLKENGVSSKCICIPGGVNSDIFNSKNRNLNNSVFKFLHIGKAENRKNTLLLLRAFNEAFQGSKDVRLTLSIDNPHVHNFDAEGYLYELYGLDVLKHDISNIDIIHFVDDIRDLYNTHHVGVFPSAAEGIGLPIIEAMGCGMPVIIPRNSGITEYANENNSILLTKLENIPVFDPNFFPISGAYGTWQTPTLDELIEKMKYCYENYSKVKIIGENAEKYIKTYYTWELAAKKFLNILN